MKGNRLFGVVLLTFGYLVRLKDERGQEGEDYAYRLTIREAHPDFILSADPGNPNVPRGGRVPVEVSADRREGFDDPIEVDAENLPPGVKAIPATIASDRKNGSRRSTSPFMLWLSLNPTHPPVTPPSH